MNLLNKTKTYLVGHMQYLSGRNWREVVTAELEPLGITCFDPYKKPFVKDVEEDEETREQMNSWMESAKYEKVAVNFSTLTSRVKYIYLFDLF